MTKITINTKDPKWIDQAIASLCLNNSYLAESGLTREQFAINVMKAWIGEQIRQAERTRLRLATEQAERDLTESLAKAVAAIDIKFE